ncbi:unnamed protein product [Bemisia tabaci]|uniref:Uncharacterized protein n=1 Tax=Bemisia tabaci TaxID=7038 RepID=A0A9P0F5V5_BEMTA|nr:PREDICTED: UPF0183 protein CG7083 [Bemisia tabaci]XP_018907514.1 PREDICTED: UPF0183 protein CG7083 [Bemisia tabaci]CAH0390282.1 unnamed protein product [Bemisia tabaci]
MLELEVVPETSLGCDQWEFVLGMHFSQAVAIIQSQVGIIKGVQVLYSDSAPLEADLVLSLPQDGIRLVFDPISQRLKIIDIVNMRLVKLKYCGMLFNTPEILPSIEQIEHSFGATHPAIYDAERQTFVLNFRGLSFTFHVDSKLQSNISHAGLTSLKFPNGLSPVVSQLSVYVGNKLSSASPPPLPFSCYQHLIFLEQAHILRDKNSTKGLRLHLFYEGVSRGTESKKNSLVTEIYFNATCQDVTTILGAPSRVFYKAEDKMKIHSPNAHKRVTRRRSDFFFNYFSLGLDILFDAKSQKAKKFVLHTNYPGHYNFNMYHRCEFNLSLPASQIQTSNTDITETRCTTLQVSAYTKWDTISEYLKPSERPVVLNRASSTNTTNPFGSTFCYGYQDIIFEVMPNNHIASMTLYTQELTIGPDQVNDEV